MNSNDNDKTMGDVLLSFCILLLIPIPLGLLSAWVLHVVAGWFLPLLVPGLGLTLVQAVAVRILYTAATISGAGPLGVDDSKFKDLSPGAVCWKLIGASLAVNGMVLLCSWLFWLLLVAR